MSVNNTNRNGSMPIPVEESIEPVCYGSGWLRTWARRAIPKS